MSFLSSEILIGDCLSVLDWMPSNSVNCCVTSPPYFGLRDYGNDGQIGLEDTPDAYVQKLVAVFREVRRVLRDDGTLWLNIGDSYATGTKAERQQSSNPGVGANRPEAQNSVRRIGTPAGLKTKDLIGIPWRLAFALQADGWYLRQDIIWHKPNPMPESVRDRCTKAHEYVFLLTKNERYHFDHVAMQEPAVGGTPGNVTHKGKTAYEAGDEKMRTKAGLTNIGAREVRNRRSVWTVPTRPFKEAHFATYPPALIEPCILAGCPVGGVVLDPFFGAGTTGLVAQQHGRKWVGIELNPEYAAIAKRRLSEAKP